MAPRNASRATSVNSPSDFFNFFAWFEVVAKKRPKSALRDIKWTRQMTF